METTIQELIEEILNRMNTPFRKIKIDKRDDTYRINIESEEPSLLIGHHGDNIFALQNLLKIMVWNKQPAGQAEGAIKIIVDVDD